MRMTHTLVALSRALMDNPSGKHWGYQLSKESGVLSGAMYPLLTRLLEAEWLDDGWEEVDPKKKKRPPRRYYTVTDLGRIEMGAVLQRAELEKRFSFPGIAPIWGPA